MAVILVKLIGIILVAFGGMYLVKPSLMKKSLRFWNKGKRFYLGGFLNIAIGLLFIKAASVSQITWIIFIFGLIAIIKGIALLILKPEDTKSLLSFFINMPAAKVRIFTFLPLIIGVLIIYSV